MNKLITLACMGLMFAASSAAIAGPQQERMKSCNKDAKEKALKGDERKAFMKGCLSGKHEAAMGEGMAMEQAPAKGKSAEQRKKMKACKKDAKEKALKGDERKAFMTECMKA